MRCIARFKSKNINFEQIKKLMIFCVFLMRKEEDGKYEWLRNVIKEM